MVIPIGDDNPTRRTPWVTWSLVTANILVFVFFEPWSGTPCEQQAFFLRWATVPAELAQGQPLLETQVDTVTQCPIDAFPSKDIWLSLFSSLFLHAGWVHLLGNMLYLWVFGNNIEDRFGHLRFLIFYVLSGLVATTVFLVPNFSSLSTVVGASGAISGVLGAYLVLFPHARITSLVPFLFFLPMDLPAVVVLGLWFILQLRDLTVSMTGGGVAYLAHVAGFVFGVVCTIAFRSARPRRQPARYYRYR